MNIIDPKQLSELLSHIKSASEKLNKLLDEEGKILETPHHEGLMKLSEQKKQCVKALEHQTKTAHVYLSNHQVPKGLFGLTQFIDRQASSTDKDQLKSLWQSIEALTEKNKTLNERNGAIIELNKRFTQRALDVLKGQVGATSTTYDAKGQASQSNTARMISSI